MTRWRAPAGKRPAGAGLSDVWNLLSGIVRYYYPLLWVAVRLRGPVATQGTMEVPMDAQPPVDTSALMEKINELQDQISQLRLFISTQISQLQKDIKQIPPLTQISYMGYSQNNPVQSQEQNGGQMQIAEQTERHYGRDKDNPPIIPEGTKVTCVRCNHQWTPHSRHPQKCPKCRAPWWFPPKWKWRQSQTQSQ